MKTGIVKIGPYRVAYGGVNSGDESLTLPDVVVELVPSGYTGIYNGVVTWVYHADEHCISEVEI